MRWAGFVVVSLLAANALATPNPEPMSVVVRADKLSAGALETRMSTGELRNVPGLGGDAVRGIELQAGVARPQLGAGQLVVWGAAPSETRVLWDGIELPALYHFGGLRAVLPTAMVDSMILLPAGYGASYGRGLGGVLLLESSPIPEGVHGEVSADLLDTSAVLAASLGEHLRLRAAGRFGYIDRVLPALTPNLGHDFFPLPRYWDAQGQGVLTFRSRDGVATELSVRFATAGDSQIRSQGSADAASAQTEHLARSSYRMGIEYLRRDSDSEVRIAPWFGWDEQRWEARFGGVDSQLSRQETRYGLRAIASLQPYRWLSFESGADVLGNLASLARNGTLTRPPREGDVAVFGQSPGREVSSDTWAAHQGNFALFVSVLLRLGRVRVAPSVRVVGMLSDVGRLLPRIGDTPPLGFRRIDFAVEPRLQIRVQPLARLALLAALGLTHQQPDAADLSAVFGNPTLGPAHAVHSAVSAELRILNPLTVELGAYFRALFDLWARSSLLTPPLARSLDQEGSGRAFGAQIVVRLSPLHNVSGSLSYSLSRSQRRDRPDLPFRMADFDQPHVLQLAMRYVLFGFGIGVRLRYASGLPRTEVVGAYYDARDDRFDPRFGRQNAIRLPDFVQLDAQIDRAFVLGNRLRVTALLDIQNVTNQQNAEELAYRYDFKERQYIRGLPVLANLGVRVSF